jgi:ubiquinol-cytochrome c reductase iron-sulfur subunit
MLGYLARGSNLAPALIATTQGVPSAAKAIIPAVLEGAEKVNVIAQPEIQTSASLAARLPNAGFLKTSASTSLSGSVQMRFAHTDVQVPDFSAYRHNSVKDPGQSSKKSEGDRKGFSYLMVAAGTVPAAYATKTVITEFVSTMSASADVLAMAKIEVNLADIPEGKNATFKWRNKPLFIRHRTDAEIDREAQVDVSSLRDQEHDLDRVQQPKWLILLGVCTHLGCVPIANAGDYGGYYCPCHGSHYDASGRIRKGPAPLNLEVPAYTFNGDTVVVG